MVFILEDELSLVDIFETSFVVAGLSVERVRFG
jgi:hypothetical protein